ncbi:hypothetical protein [Pelagicoccus sp. SDUM812005]|uniref:hypothetical protein n=1 Tax=Pelagicoccus sp. SDUM812005 TaxID=3041257 RepID=UPI00280F5F5C|nr:hypothetical protein [Pelagicoccus sp. SDUM812005]MDQ8183871.1 hypothetical protein [Pelagicoccus sp. SDUM812005]
MRTLLLIVSAILLTGFSIETPETIKAAEKQAKRWKKEVNRRFDMKELHKFLEATIAANPTLNEIDLSKAKIGKKWIHSDMSFTSGDWVFSYNSKAEDFEFIYTYGDEKFIGLRCKRKSKKEFEYIEPYLDEWIVLSCQNNEMPIKTALTTAASAA